MKAIWLFDNFEHIVDGVFVVPKCTTKQAVQEFVDNVKDNHDCIDNIRNNLPEGWEFYDKFSDEESVLY